MGTFQNDDICGNGLYVYRDGSTYEGEFYRNRKEVNGILTVRFNNSVERYDGYFKEDLMHGFGKY